MAAPTLSAKDKNQNKPTKQKQANRQQHTDGARKVSRKNILFSPYNADWPEITADIEDKVLCALIQKLQNFPRLEPERKKPGTDSAGDQNKEAEDVDLIRQKIRCQLAIGHRQVTKGLERGELSLLLVWRDAQPPLLTASLLPLAASRACPALCLKQLVPKVSDVTGLSSLVALGFRKSQAGLDDFESFVAMATELAPPVHVPGIKRNEAQLSEDEQNIVESQKAEPAKPQSQIDWPVTPSAKEEEILEKLKVLLQPYKAVFKKQRPKFASKEWKDKRKTMREFLITDVAAIGDAVRSGKLDLLLVQSKADLLSPTLNSVAIETAQKGRAVLHMTSLKTELAPVLRNPSLKALGFRKSSNSARKLPAGLSEFIEYAAKCVSPDLHNLVPPTKDTSNDAAKEAASDDKVHTQNSSKVSEEKEDTKKSEEKGDNKSASETPQKPPVPFFDVSHLYVYKKDKKKASTETQAESGFLSLEADDSGKGLPQKAESFISLRDPKPTIEYIWPDDVVGDPKVVSMLFDSEGNFLRYPTLRAEKDRVENPSSSASFQGVMGLGNIDSRETTKENNLKRKLDSAESNRVEETRGDNPSSSGSFQGVMGLEITDSPEAAPFYPESGNAKNKKNLKRKLNSSSETGNFLSFKLGPTNVQTSISNPNKKKNKKMKKR